MLKPKRTLGYSPIGNGHSITPFEASFDARQDIFESMKGVDAVVFWGGTDINPSLYGEKANPQNQSNGLAMSKRDKEEWRAMLYCKANDIPMIGVCRGAQLLCAFAGGKLVQHTTGHTGGSGWHQMQTSDGSIMEVTSCHHQMMYPWDIPHELLGWSHMKRSDTYQGATTAQMEKAVTEREPEVVYFPTVRGLAIQGHPEWAMNSSRFVQYCNEMIEQKLFSHEVVTQE